MSKQRRNSPGNRSKGAAGRKVGTGNHVPVADHAYADRAYASFGAERAVTAPISLPAASMQLSVDSSAIPEDSR